ncbi:MAG: DNA-3-methyladenine glycosylase [Bacillota bacterium]|jgi:DNA-3-methyladenine glycosylase II|nr:DNA-3-methyladenine glycosylase [Bacillota bacterium]NLJ01926.1 DNA-3-methyladenine glycosylase 2 family protein [Bacillota bacterium]
MPERHYFQYGTAETEYLKSRDRKLGDAIDRIGPIKRELYPELYPALVKSIVGQQISTKAQQTIWTRMKERFQPFKPEVLGRAALEELQRCGISLRKAGYIRDLTRAVLEGEVNLAGLQTMSDAEVCRELTKLKGVGPWTAEMMLIFSLQRPDVVSYGDLAIQRGMRMLYRHRQLTPELFERYRRRYSPYGTVASLYLWAIAGGAMPELSDPAPKQKK